MAAFVRTSFTNNYRNLDPSKTLLNEAIAGGSAQNLKSLMQVLRQPDFIIEGTTDDNTAALNGGAAQSYLVNLSDEGGVSFPAGYDRDIIIEAWTRDETGPNYQRFMQTVRGSATAPAATGGVRNLGPKVGGRVTFSSAAATAADAYGGFSITSAATATGRYAAAVPKARRLIKTSGSIEIIGTGAGADAILLNLNARTLASGVIELGIRAADDGASIAPADTHEAHVEFDLLPVENPELAFDTTTTPDEVLVGAVGQASENVEWLVHVYVGPLRPNSAATDSD